MNYIKESTWFKSLKFLFVSFLFISFSSTIFSQDIWKVKVAFDNTIYIQNYWSEDTEEIRVIVAAAFSKSIYGVNTEIHQDNWIPLVFPDDFELIHGDTISMNSSQELVISIKKKRETVHKETFIFEPSLNLLLQLDNYKKKDIPNIWGESIDAYTWDDKNGKNVIARSYLINTSVEEGDSIEDVYLYFYHYIITETNEWKLLRKFTDSFKGCKTNNVPTFNIESIELTDINRDTIGEISTFYVLNCAENNSLPYTLKSLMSTDGEKYMVIAELDPCSDKPIELNSSLNLSDRMYFERFLRKKLLKNL
jgi:hypothetical protein